MTAPLRSPRFEIHRQEIKRSESLGGQPRTVYHAWFHSQDIAYPVCVVTLWTGWSDFAPEEDRTAYVEWIYVDDQFRRQGIATEVLDAIQLEVGPLTITGVTDDGDAFCEFYNSRVQES